MPYFTTIQERIAYERAHSLFPETPQEDGFPQPGAASREAPTDSTDMSQADLTRPGAAFAETPAVSTDMSQADPTQPGAASQEAPAVSTDMSQADLTRPGAAFAETPETSGSSGSVSVPASLNRLPSADFQTLLCVYDHRGVEWSVSPVGTRRIRRALPRRGWFHKHEFVELFYVAEGSFDQLLLGERRRFLPGAFVITDQNCEHSDYIEAVDAAVLFLQIEPEYLDELLRSYPQTDELHRFLLHALYQQKREQSFLELAYAPDGTVSGAADTQVPFLLEQLVREDLGRQPGFEHIRRGLLIRLLQRLCTDYAGVRHSSSQENREKALLYELERFIRLHDADVTIRSLEQTFHYHRNYFHLLLQKYRGQTFQKYVQQVRMDHARQLLEETSLPIRQVALAVGYENTSHFYRLFRERFGIPPRQVRD